MAHGKTIELNKIPGPSTRRVKVLFYKKGSGRGEHIIGRIARTKEGKVIYEN